MKQNLYKEDEYKLSTLNKEYIKYLNKISKTISEDEQARWDTYNIILNELFSNNKKRVISEIKYRITDGENPNEVFLDVLDRDDIDLNNIDCFVKKRIEEYLDEDFYKKFFTL